MSSVKDSCKLNYAFAWGSTLGSCASTFCDSTYTVMYSVPIFPLVEEFCEVQIDNCFQEVNVLVVYLYFFCFSTVL